MCQSRGFMIGNQRGSGTESRTAFLETEGIIAPSAQSAARSSTKRDFTFSSQRFTPKAPVEPPETPWSTCAHHRSSSALSQAPTIASSYKSKYSMKDRVSFLSLRRSPIKLYSSDEATRLQLAKAQLGEERANSKKRFFDGIWTPRSKRNTLVSRHRRAIVKSDTPSLQDVLPPSPEYQLPAPAPDFGDIPGVGYEKSRPQLDRSSGAAARAAAAAQNELLENMRRMTVRNMSDVRDSESGIGIESGENRTSLSVPVRRKDPVASLPPEITSCIFAYLDAESVINGELVSRSWRALAATQHTWKRVFQSEIRPPRHRAFTDCCQSDEEVYPDVSWKRRWQVHKALAQRWANGAAGAFYLEGHSENIYCVQFDDEKIVTGSKDRTIRIWSTRQVQCVNVLGLPTKRFDPQEMDRLPDSTEPAPLTTQFSAIRSSHPSDALPFCHSGSILCLQYDDRILVTGSSDSTLIVWEKESTFHFKPVKHLTEHSKGVLDVCFDEQYIVSCSKDHDICLWERESGRLLRKMTGHRGPVNAVKLKGHLIASASGDGLVKLWNRCSGLCIKEFASSSRGLACVELSPDSRVIWAGGNDHEIYEFDANNGMLALKLGAHSNLVRSLFLDSNSGRLVSGSYDNNIKIFDTQTKEEIANLSNWSASWILSARADYRRIVATSQDRRVILIDFGYGLDGINALDPGSYGQGDAMAMRWTLPKGAAVSRPR